MNNDMNNEIKNLLLEKKRLTKRLQIIEKHIAIINNCQHGLVCDEIFGMYKM